MSSSILRAGDGHLALPMVWREVSSEAGSGADPLVRAGRPRPAPSNEVPLENPQLEIDQQSRVQEAHSAGMRKGEIAGHARGAAELQPVIEKMSRAVEELAGMRSHLRKEAEGDTIKLAMAIARRILRRELAADPEVLQGILRAALERLKGQEISRVRVHPSHAALVTACLQGGTGGNPIEVIADPSRDPGDVIFETQRGSLDASVESQLQEIERGLADRLRKHS